MIEIKRIAAAGRRFKSRFWSRVFTEEEQKLASERNEFDSFYAGRFAAKEAVLKAVGTGLRNVRWLDVEIVRGDLGEPIVQIHGALLEQMHFSNISRISVSISHSREFAIASAIAVRDLPFAAQEKGFEQKELR